MKKRWTLRQMMIAVAATALLMATFRLEYRHRGRLKGFRIRGLGQIIGIDYGKAAGFFFCWDRDVPRDPYHYDD
jgi:hypothetical protein